MTDWKTERVSWSTALLHEAWPRISPAVRLCRIAEPTDRAIVLGSSTVAASFNLEQARREGFTVVRRGSGGGAVIVEPGAQIWLMLYLRQDDPLVVRDLGMSFLWLGRVVLGVLADLGLHGEMVTTRQPRTDLGKLICFNDLGFGEVTVGGVKVLGLAQRRSGGQVCFQVSLLWQSHQELLGRWLVSGASIAASVRSGGLSSLVPLARQSVQDRLVRAVTTI